MGRGRGRVGAAGAQSVASRSSWVLGPDTAHAPPHMCSARFAFSFCTELTQVVCHWPLQVRGPLEQLELTARWTPPPRHTYTHTPPRLTCSSPSYIYFLLREGLSSSIFKHTWLLQPLKGRGEVAVWR